MTRRRRGSSAVTSCTFDSGISTRRRVVRPSSVTRRSPWRSSRKPQCWSSAPPPERAQLAAKASRRKASTVSAPRLPASCPKRSGSSVVLSSMATTVKRATAPMRRWESPNPRSSSALFSRMTGASSASASATRPRPSSSAARSRWASESESALSSPSAPPSPAVSTRSSTSPLILWNRFWTSPMFWMRAGSMVRALRLRSPLWISSRPSCMR